MWFKKHSKNIQCGECCPNCTRPDQPVLLVNRKGRRYCPRCGYDADPAYRPYETTEYQPRANDRR